jgi:hypothetical protein
MSKAKGENMFRYRIVMLFVVFAAILAIVPLSHAQQEQTQQEQTQQEQTQQEEYSESALRRFEIVTLSSLPFAAVHSYLGVRGVRMIQTNKIAPMLTPQNYRIMGISAVSLSLFIGIWDWVHTRNVDRSAPSVPGRKPPAPPTEEELPPDGSIARVPSFGPQANRYGASTNHAGPHSMSVNTQLNMWATEPSIGLFVPLLEIRF